MPQLKVAREVVVVSVTDDKAFRPGQSGVELCRHLARHGVRTTFEAVQRSNREVPASCSMLRRPMVPTSWSWAAMPTRRYAG